MRVSTVIYGALVYIVLILLVTLPSSLASILDDPHPFKIIDLEYAGVNAVYNFSGGRDPLITGNGLKNKTLGQSISVDLNIQLLNYLFWRNNVHGATERQFEPLRPGQFRTIGWLFFLGVNATDWLELYYRHHSQHILDHKYPFDGFPVEDGIGFTLKIYSGDKHGGIF